jgi:hypothetical protein
VDCTAAAYVRYFTNHAKPGTRPGTALRTIQYTRYHASIPEVVSSSHPWMITKIDVQHLNRWSVKITLKEAAGSPGRPPPRLAKAVDRAEGRDEKTHQPLVIGSLAASSRPPTSPAPTRPPIISDLKSRLDKVRDRPGQLSC